MEKVIFKDELLFYFDELIFILFGQEYFSNEENATRYVDKIVDFIILEINSFYPSGGKKGKHHPDFVLRTKSFPPETGGKNSRVVFPVTNKPNLHQLRQITVDRGLYY